MAALSSDPAPIEEVSSSQIVVDAETSLEQEASSHEEVGCSQEVETIEVHKQKRVEIVRKHLEEILVAAKQPSLPTPNSTSEVDGVVSASAEASSFSVTDSVTKSFSSTPGYLANRWNSMSNSFSSSFSTPTSSQVPTFSTPRM